VSHEPLDPYVVLGLPHGASLLEIARARRRLAKQFHPDVAAGDAATARMQAINEAWHTLSQHGRPSHASPKAPVWEWRPDTYEAWRPAGASMYASRTVESSGGRTGWYVLAAMSLFLVLILVGGLVAAADGPAQPAPYAPIQDNLGR
jgi:DnaJ domain